MSSPQIATTVLDLALRFNLKRKRRSWRGNCPACGYVGTFVVSTGRTGRPIGWCASCQDRQAVAAALAGATTAPVGRERTERSAENHRRRLVAAIKVWDEAGPLRRSLGERYLVHRSLASLVDSPMLRFHPACRHPEHGTFPALVALVQDAAGAILGVHRTYLGSDGSKACIEPAKASLGPIWGGLVHLQETGGGPLIVGEGVETAASAGLLAGLPAWAAVSAGNLEKAAQLPPNVRDVVIAADPDPPGIRAAAAAKVRWLGEGRRVRIMRPNAGNNLDFNDLLLDRGGARAG